MEKSNIWKHTWSGWKWGEWLSSSWVGCGPWDHATCAALLWSAHMRHRGRKRWITIQWLIDWSQVYTVKQGTHNEGHFCLALFFKVVDCLGSSDKDLGLPVLDQWFKVVEFHQLPCGLFVWHCERRPCFMEDHLISVGRLECVDVCGVCSMCMCRNCELGHGGDGYMCNTYCLRTC